MIAHRNRASFLTCILVCVIGCNEHRSTSDDKHASKPMETTQPAVTSKPVVAPTAASSADKKHFWFTYQFEPKGRRDWVKVDDKHWEERWESGEVMKYNVVRRYEKGDTSGTIVTRDDGSLDVLIPDAGKGAAIKFRDPKGNDPDAWVLLGNVEGYD